MERSWFTQTALRQTSQFDHVVSDTNVAGVGLDCFTASATIRGANNLINSVANCSNGGQAQCNDLDGQTLAVDQRGLPRPIGGCDIGAFELQ